MGDVDGPEQADLMIPPVQPVIKEILSEKQDEPIGKHIRNGNPMVTVAYIQDQQVSGPEEQIDAPVDQHQVKVGESVLPCIHFLMPVVAQQRFQADDDEIQGGRDQQ